MQTLPDHRLSPLECRCAWHSDDCGCAHCHEHKEHHWRDWPVYPACAGCQAQLMDLLKENTDYFDLLKREAA